MTLNTVSFCGEKLVEMKKTGCVPGDVLEFLRKAADAHLSGPQYCVTKRKMKALSGNPHDYASIGTYWWPNPDTPDGLPYVRRDGEVTPAAIDSISYENMARKAFELSLAAFYFDNEAYAKAAEKTIYDWHLNPETYMTPHAEYSQSIPGICTGRGIGIIDFRFSYMIFDSVAILEYLGCISEENVAGIKKWYTEFTDWLLTSANGIEEDTELNNHGTYYDVQILASAIFTKRKALIKKICTTAYKRRFLDQVEPDGSQPLELARTTAMNYSASNIKGLFLIANMADMCGYKEFFEVDSERGVCILKSAVDYIYKYVKNPELFKYKEIKYKSVPGRMASILYAINSRFNGEGYIDKAKELFAEPVLEQAIP